MNMVFNNSVSRYRKGKISDTIVYLRAMKENKLIAPADVLVKGRAK